ncbi:hypothetical protein SAMN05660485_03815, partial [Blastococcus fimeti]
MLCAPSGTLRARLVAPASRGGSPCSPRVPSVHPLIAACLLRSIADPPGPLLARGRQVAVHSCAEPGGRRNPSSGGIPNGRRPARTSTHREVVPRHVHSLGRSLPAPLRDGGRTHRPAAPRPGTDRPGGALTCTYTADRRPMARQERDARRPPGSGVHRAWGRTGGNQGSAGGRGAVAVHGGRVVHVSTTGRRSPPTPGQQGCWGADLRKGARSPASTRVMTRMKYFYPNFLEPHSGWGRSAGQAPQSLDSTNGISRWSTHRGTGF